MSDREPPLARDLSGIGPGDTWRYGEKREPLDSAAPGETPEEELERLRSQIRFFAGALEDVVALALSGADYKERAIMMHRRAVAALSGVGFESAPARPPGGGGP